MKAIFCLCFCGPSIALYAQSALQTFTSPDGAFQLKYSAALIRCTPQSKGDARWWIPDLCNSQAELCGDHASPNTTIVCFARPRQSEYFTGAFFVAEVRAPEQPITRKACLEGSPGWWPPETARKTTRGQSTRINTINAKLFRVTDSWTSGFQTGEIYRVFHGNKCYELGIQDAGATSTAFEPEQYEEIEKAAKEDDKNYGQLLPQVLHSFRFLAVGRP